MNRYAGDFLQTVYDDVINLEETIALTREEYETLLESGQIDESKYYAITDDDLETVYNDEGVGLVLNTMMDTLLELKEEVKKLNTNYLLMKQYGLSTIVLIYDHTKYLGVAEDAIPTYTVIDESTDGVIAEGKLDITVDAIPIVLGKLGTFKVSCDGYEAVKVFSRHETQEVHLGLTTETWKGIQQIVRSGLAPEYFKVGDIIPVTLKDGETYKFYVAGIDIYEPNTLTLIAAEPLLEKIAMNPTLTNSGGWPASDLRDWLNNDFLARMPDDLVEVIKPKTLKRSGGQTAPVDYTDSTDIIWIPSAYEFGFTLNEANWNYERLYHRIYPLYNDIIRRYPPNKYYQYAYIWTSTPGTHTDHKNDWNTVYGIDSISASQAANITTYHTLPGFDIG